MKVFSNVRKGSRNVPAGFRRGSVVVDFAVVLPVVLLLFFGFWEFARMEMIRHACATAAYEGARVGIIEGAQVSEVEAAANQHLSAVGVSVATVTVTPSPITSLSTDVTVTVDVPLDANAYVTPTFFKNQQVSSTFTLRRDIFD